MEAQRRLPFDVDAYEQRVRRAECFICGIVRGDSAYAHHIIFRDDCHIAFLSQFPAQRGYSLVAPIDHRENVVTDFSRGDHIEFDGVFQNFQAVRAASYQVGTDTVIYLDASLDADHSITLQGVVANNLQASDFLLL